MSQILNGIRVLDFGRYIAGPFCATLLGDLGADVIRIEKPSGGEDRYTVPISSEGEGAHFIQIGRNKRGMTLAPRSAEGQEILRRLVKTADVVVANLPFPTLKKLGLDYETLRGLKEDIILTTCSAFGSEGPYATRRGFDSVTQAMSGGMHLSGVPGIPAKAIAPYCDFGTASLSAMGTIAALMHREKTGEGQIVEGTLLGTALNFNNAVLMEEAVLQLGREGSGTRSQSTAPTDTFSTRDGWVTVQIVGRGMFERWTKLIGETHWLENPDFTTDQQRGDHRDIICERMQKWCGLRSSEDAITALTKAGIPCGELLTPEKVLVDEHVNQAKMFQNVDYPGVSGPAPVAAHPVRYSRSAIAPFRRAPTLGEHTEEVLREIRYRPGEISDLRENGVI